jgi:hypothetical protein
MRTVLATPPLLLLLVLPGLLILALLLLVLLLVVSTSLVSWSSLSAPSQVMANTKREPLDWSFTSETTAVLLSEYSRTSFASGPGLGEKMRKMNED